MILDGKVEAAADSGSELSFSKIREERFPEHALGWFGYRCILASVRLGMKKVL